MAIAALEGDRGGAGGWKRVELRLVPPVEEVDEALELCPVGIPTPVPSRPRPGSPVPPARIVPPTWPAAPEWPSRPAAIGDAVALPAVRRLDDIAAVADWSEEGWFDDRPHLELVRVRRSDRDRQVRLHRVQGRRRLVVGLLVATVVAILALPSPATAGRPAAASPPPAVSSLSGAAGMRTVVVQPGETLWSLAQRIDGTGDPRALAAAISRQLGSDAVHPGERILVP